MPESQGQPDPVPPEPHPDTPATAQPVASAKESVVYHDDPFMRVMGRLIYAEACRYDYR